MLNYLKSERGASAVEYALLIAAVAGTLALGAYHLKTSVDGGLTAAAAQVATTDAGHSGPGADPVPGPGPAPGDPKDKDHGKKK